MPRMLATIALLALMLGTAAPADAAGPQPRFAFPWRDGETWRLTNAPHPALELAGVPPTSALDFQPLGVSGCRPLEAPQWVRPMAPGRVVVTPRIGAGTQPYVVTIDHGAGWSSMYLHLGSKQVRVGQYVDRNTDLGHPACLGGRFTGAHVHVAISKDGKFVSLIGMEIGGWLVLDASGAMRRGNEMRRVMSPFLAQPAAPAAPSCAWMIAGICISPRA